MLNPINCILQNLIDSECNTYLCLLKQIDIISILSQKNRLILTWSEKEGLPENNIYIAPPNLAAIEYWMTPNAILCDNPHQIEAAVALYKGYHIPLIVIFDNNTWSQIRKVDNIIIQKSIPEQVLCVSFDDQPQQTIIERNIISIPRNNLQTIIEETIKRVVIL